MEKQSLKKRIINQIEQGRLKMRPRWHFVFQAIIFVVLMVIILISLLYFFSFFFFATRTSGLWHLIAFGPRGFVALVNAFPWLLFGSILIFVIILEMLIRKFSFGWRRSFVYTFLGIILIASFASWLLAQSSFHNDFYRQAWNDGLPLVGPLYRQQARIEFDNIYRGEIIVFDEEKLKIKTEDGRELEFPWGDRIKIPVNDFIIGERIITAVRKEGGQWKAWRIIRFREGFFENPPGRQMKNFEINKNPGLY